MPTLITPLPNRINIKNRPNTPEDTGRWVKRTMASDTAHTKPTMASCKAV